MKLEYRIMNMVMRAFENPYAGYDDADAKIITQAFDSIRESINIGLGVLLAVLLVAFGITTSLDLVYLTWSNGQTRLEKLIEKRKNGDNRAMFGIVSKTAVDSYEEAMEVGKNPVMIYFGHRFMLYVVLVVVMFAIIAGYDFIVAWVAKVLMGALELVKGSGY